MKQKSTMKHQNKLYKDEKKSQEKKSLTSHHYIYHNFSIRGSLHIINLNSKHVQTQISSRRRIKAREKSIERKLPTRIFNDETRLTGSELLQVMKNEEVRWFKNGTSVPPEHSTYLSEPFNPHKAKKIYASREQKAAEKYFVKVVREKFHDFKTPDVLSLREKAIEKVFAKFRNHENIRPIMLYVKNLFVTYDEHLYSKMSMKEKVDHHIDLIIKNTSEERGRTAEERSSARGSISNIQDGPGIESVSHQAAERARRSSA